MHGSERSAQTVRFGIFEAHLQTEELYKNGIKVPLEGQPFHVCSLLEHPGELVKREELRQGVWPEDTFVDFVQMLNTASVKIRLALGDDADNPRFVSDGSSDQMVSYATLRGSELLGHDIEEGVGDVEGLLHGHIRDRRASPERRTFHEGLSTFVANGELTLSTRGDASRFR